MRQCSIVRCGVLVLVSAASCALAGPPLQTDDPETLEKGKFELNTAYTLSLSRRDGDNGRTWDQEAPIFDLNYGLTDGIQLKIEIPLVVMDASGGASVRAGIGDASIGSKLRLVKEEESKVGVSIYPAIGVPLGNRGKGLGTGSPSITLPVQIGKHFLGDKVFVYADAGYQEEFAQGEADFLYTGLAVEYEVSETFVLCGEVRWEPGLRDSPDDSLFNAGVKWKLTEHAAFLGSAGRSFAPKADSGSDLLLYLGVQWSF